MPLVNTDPSGKGGFLCGGFYGLETSPQEGQESIQWKERGQASWPLCSRYLESHFSISSPDPALGRMNPRHCAHGF